MKILALAGLALLLPGCSAHFGASMEVSPAAGSTENPNQVKTQPASAARSAGEKGASAATAGGVFPYTVHRSTLPNGLKLLLVPMPADGLVSYWSIVRTGSRDEIEEGVTGFAHFFEHCMFRGTKNLPAKEYDAVVNGIGADANAFTNDDLTAYHLSFAAEDLPTVVKIEADRFQNLEYDEAAFKTESGAVYGEYRKGRTSPFQVLFEALQNAAFDVHTYKHTTIGFEADIKRMPEQFQYSKGFFQRFYRPENVVILVAGDIDPAKTRAMIEERYSAWKPGYKAPVVPTEPEQTAQRRLDVSFEGKTLPLLAIAFKGERFLPTDRRMNAASLVGELAFGETSALYKKLVLDEQRVEFVAPLFDLQRDPGLWSVLTRVKDPSDVAAVEGEIWSTIEALHREPPSAERLDQARSRLKYGFLTELSTPSGVCESLAYPIAITGDLTCMEERFATLDKVTPKDVQAAAAHYLRRERSTVAVLSGIAEDLGEALAGAAPPVLLPVEQDPNVAFKIWFRVGSQDDPPGKEGLAALTATLVGESGTRSLTYDQMLAKLYPMAAGFGVSVDKEMTVASGLVHRDKLGEFYDLFTAALLHPGFRAEDFERARDQASTAIAKGLRYSSDEELGKAVLYGQVFRGTPYAHLDLGTVESLDALTLEDVKAFHAAHYTRDAMVVGLGGAYPADLPQRLQADLAKLPEGAKEPPPAPRPAPIRGRQVVIVEKPGQSTAISFGYPIDLHRGSREFCALWIANSWLGEHRNSSSHLYQVIREARGLNYGDYSYIEAFPNGGGRGMPPTGVGRRAQLFEVWIRPVEDANAVFAFRAALRELENLIENGLTREQFEATRTFLKKYSLHFAETTSERLGYAIDDRYYGLEQPHLATFRRTLDEITLEECNAAVRKHLQTRDFAVAMVTADAAGLKQRLVSGAKSPIDYKGIEKPAAILAEDREIETWPLGITAENVRIVPVDEVFERSGPQQ